MLVLARKIGESVDLGNDIRVTVTGIQGGIVKLGFEAPREMKILRTELPRRGEQGQRGQAMGGRCPNCGYTADDARLHGDHHLCKRYPFFAFETKGV